MRQWVPIFWALALGATMAACKSESARGNDSSAPGIAAKSAVSAQLPVKEDFEEEATETITEDNLEASLSALEKEIGEDAER